MLSLEVIEALSAVHLATCRILVARLNCYHNFNFKSSPISDSNAWAMQQWSAVEATCVHGRTISIAAFHNLLFLLGLAERAGRVGHVSTEDSTESSHVTLFSTIEDAPNPGVKCPEHKALLGTPRKRAIFLLYRMLHRNGERLLDSGLTMWISVPKLCLVATTPDDAEGNKELIRPSKLRTSFRARARVSASR